MSEPLIITNARLVTLVMGPRPRRGDDMGELSVVPSADLLLEKGKVVSIMPAPSALRDMARPGTRVIDACGRVVMPGLIDCHTHACWAGSRVDEWDKKLGGATYLEILRSGGGIMSTVRAVREASQKDLAELLLERLFRMVGFGATTIEVKSGYGLSTHDELKMLHAIRDAADRFPGTVVPTALLGHAIDPDVPREQFLKTVIQETLPAISAEFHGIAIDAYCEKEAWSPGECMELFEAAAAREHPCRVHADQFNALGMTSTAITRGFVSVDHLEASTPAQIEQLGRSGTVGVVLPVSGFHLDNRYADAKSIIAKGGAVAIASNSNPGSAPTCSLPFAMGVGVRRCGLSPAQAIVGATVNAAHVLHTIDRGTIAPGARADLLILRGKDERELVYDVADNPVACVIVAGRVLRGG